MRRVNYEYEIGMLIVIKNLNVNIECNFFKLMSSMGLSRISSLNVQLIRLHQ